ncbi:MAG TPA: WecB/TagA/CpsF family glycosyltransferase [Terracidiphilus sp.]|jgi:N-acetylglucosaminyldiphosphoundecaprenol N-acetyl-beta-D-mannosaminyltransferase
MTPRSGSLLQAIDEKPYRSNDDSVAGEKVTEPEDRANVLGVEVEALDLPGALAQIEAALKAQRKGYICMTGVHGIMEAQRDPEVLKTYAGSFMNLPDGTPTVWVGRLQGHQSIQRVTGPDLMVEIFRRRQFAGYRHFFYGGKSGIAEELAQTFSRRFPWSHIVGTYTPPFRDLTLLEERQLISLLRGLQPSIVWVGISTPRQELFMRRYLPLLDTTLMFGVGAAFDFHTGRIRDCADWIKRAGLQWLHRLMQDPRHLLWRYMRNNPAFLSQISLQMAGLRHYEVPEGTTFPRQDDSPDCKTSADICTPSCG